MPTIEVNGVRLYYELTGEAGDPMILIHGSWGDHANWQAMVPGLSKSFRVLTYDRRGHSKAASTATQLYIQTWPEFSNTVKVLMNASMETMLVHNLDLKGRILAAEEMETNGLSFENSTSVATMRRLGMTEIVSFDRDFDRVHGVARIEPRNRFG